MLRINYEDNVPSLGLINLIEKNNYIYFLSDLSSLFHIDRNSSGIKTNNQTVQVNYI